MNLIDAPWMVKTKNCLPEKNLVGRLCVCCFFFNFEGGKLKKGEVVKWMEN